ncbi:cell division protein FtsZ [Neisseriaceae bacterium TC5R-5]|nr:cell division protein FtsZ [Neisseriaceae bacterium TC5R-5]
MSELQIGVLVLGGVVIALVYGFNFFQEWRFRRKTSQAFVRPHNDVLLDVPKNHVRDGIKQDRMEPILADNTLANNRSLNSHFDAHSTATSSAHAHAVLEREESNSTLDDNRDVSFMSSADHQALMTAMLDPSLDFIAELVFHSPHELLTIPRFNVSKRTQLIGRTEKGLWKPAETVPGTRYKQMNISMQMVDRGGAVTEQELNSFCQQVARFAEEHQAAVSFPQQQQKLVAARELDRFCADVDVLIGINIVPRQPIEGARLRSFVEAAGLQLEPDGAFHYLADSGNTLYSLMATDQTPLTFHTLLDKSFPALTLLFDVPRVAGGVDVFDRTVHFGQQLAKEFDAQLVDDNRKPLSDAGLQRTREQLLHIYSSMDDRGIAPGSVAALRLFA